MRPDAGLIGAPIPPDCGRLSVAAILLGAADMARRFSFRPSLTLACALALTPLACGAATEAPTDEIELDGAEPDDTESVSLAVGGDVEQAVSSSCSTTSVKGLSEQIVEQMNCLIPEALSEVPERANFHPSAATFPFMQTKARDALVAALDANPEKTLSVNSMLRTVAQQYLLWRWAAKGRCGISIAASPGKSNHESGLAIDINSHATWKTALQARGFHWYGSGDKPHFDYAGTGKKQLKGMDVKAFQILWNRNNAEDIIDEDGAYGPATGARLAKSPANGFPLGASCE